MKLLFFLSLMFTSTTVFPQAYALYDCYTRNDFSGGKVIINSQQYDVTSELGVLNRWAIPDGMQYVTAFNSQSVNGSHSYTKWKKNGVDVTTNLTYGFTASLPPGQGYTIEMEAQYISTYDVTVCNSTGGGQVKVNGTTYNVSRSETITEPSYITVSALIHEINGISYSFVDWSSGSTQSYNYQFSTNINSTLVANFEGRPNNDYRNQYFNPKVVGQPIKVYWSQHPDTNVTQYKVYRKPKYGSESCVGTFARTGTSSYVYTFTDPDMVHTNSSSSYDLYYYDVRAYYSLDGTYSDYDFEAVYAEMGGPQRDDTAQDERMQIFEKTYEYGISNYPNPYNPTTTISYSIKEQGTVQITVYDALGRKIVDLVNEIKQPGSYDAMFNGSNLTSGIYFYTMKVNDFMETKKMLLTK